MSLYRDVAVVVLNTLLLAAALEGAALGYEHWRPTSAIEFDYAPYRMVKMTRAPWPLNRDGFRASEWSEYQNHFVVEFLGGSVCLGIGSNTGPSIPERLQATLWKAGLSDARVVNLCQGGATSGQELAIFAQYGLALKPQVVLSFDGANDILHPSPIGDDAAANLPYLDSAMRGHSLLSHMAFARVLARRLRRTKPAPVDEDEVERSYIGNLLAVRRLAGDSLHAVLLQPVTNVVAPRYTRARDALRASSLRLVDLTTIQAPFSDHVHFTGPEGYEQIFRELGRQGLIGELEARYRACSH